MTIHYTDDQVTLHHGDALDVLRALPDASVDSVVTDPPYGLAELPTATVTAALTAWLTGDRAHVPDGRGFMGNDWDRFVPPPALWDECYRALKPGGHLLAFCAPRTVDLLTMSIRLADFEIRDGIDHLFGSGFPKSLDVSKAIDKRGGNGHLAGEIAAAIKAARERRGWATGQADRHFCGGTTNWSWFEGRQGICRPPTPEMFARIVAEWPELAPLAEAVAEADREVIGQKSSDPLRFKRFKEQDGRTRATFGNDVTEPATDAARQWAGWGTALKPAREPIVMARKPLAGTVAANVLAYGTGALNVDACRVGSDSTHRTQRGTTKAWEGGAFSGDRVNGSDAGRWPTNVVLSHAGNDVDGDLCGDGCVTGCPVAELDAQSGVLISGANPTRRGSDKFRDAYGDFKGQTQCTPARGADSGGASRFFPVFRYEAKAPTSERPKVDGEAHSTVKPLSLMRWLVQLVTPPGGTVLEPFAGSGTTIEACLIENFRCIAVEREAKYLPLIMSRISKPIAPTLFSELLDGAA